MRCANCSHIRICSSCGSGIESFHHVGVRSSYIAGSSVWHYAIPCGHRTDVKEVPLQASGSLAVYNGGPLWKKGYQWFNVYWGTFWKDSPWVSRIDTAVLNIETNPSYSGLLAQYNVGMGGLKGSQVIDSQSPASVSSADIGNAISEWVKSGEVPDLGVEGAYNVFLSPGISASLSGEKSCSVFCDYHDTVGGNSGPFFTCEPYPCATGCNQCDSDPFFTLTQGLSEEMVELKTDMNPGTGWVIGNEEICDYCDRHFVCNKISTGEYVNAWYDNSSGTCWSSSMK